jgi:hypothetical protein
MGGYVHAFIVRAIDDQWAEFNADRRLPLQRKTDFALGLLAGFRERLRSQEEAWVRQNNPTFAMIRREDPELKAYIGRRYPHLRRCGGSGRRIQKDVHDAGVEAGRRTILHKPIEHTRRSRGHLITA